MTPFFYIQLLFYRAVEFLAAAGCVYWISLTWTQAPPAFPASLAGRRDALVFAGVFAAVPLTVSQLLRLVLMAQHHDLIFWRIWGLAAICLTAVYGLFWGMAASCCAGAASPPEKFRMRAAVILAALLTFAPPWSSATWVDFVIHAFCVAAILAFGRILMGEAPAAHSPGNVPPPPLPPAEPPWIALGIGFLPSVLILLTFTAASLGLLNGVPKATGNTLLWTECGVSVASCFTASFLLFRRKRAATIAGGILFLFLNGFLAFFFGCCASFHL